jgi:hypothetical protein
MMIFYPLYHILPCFEDDDDLLSFISYFSHLIYGFSLIVAKKFHNTFVC